MKTTLMAACLSLVAGMAAADPIEGLWQTQPDDGAYAHVKIAPCGPAFCGTIVQSFKDSGPYDSPNVGKEIVIDMVPAGEGAYAGKVWRPSNDKIYIGKIALSGGSMKLSGCVVGGLICKSQTWTKVD
ncbi:uncharacterized protein (DUF2147 family) [Rhodobacter viridis]|uniref:Uncharacterized protein (DUF2147 family) n=1 Tax=Rhodobacter viridis TaxID=1054202 RepID=A0A318TYS4_9RHOB|nr:DUF2147 domain-containing protein [Rhodobacter viridis]PYF09484.1 uncharacterized protein (DUF2147 family) [Rhodobacter viridis]